MLAEWLKKSGHEGKHIIEQYRASSDLTLQAAGTSARILVRAFLDRVYDAAAWLAALFLVGTLAMVLLGIAGRLLGQYIPGTDAYAGYCMAGSGFLALAHTLKRGEHIRVSLLLEHTSGSVRHRLELWSLAVATLLAAAFAWYSAQARLPVLAVQRHLDGHRCDAAVDSAADDGIRHAGARDRIRRRAGARMARPAPSRRTRGSPAQ